MRSHSTSPNDKALEEQELCQGGAPTEWEEQEKDGVIGSAQKTRNEVLGALCAQNVKSTASQVSGWFH